MPNVGKSSLINSLLRTRAVAVGNLPGITKIPQARTSYLSPSLRQWGADSIICEWLLPAEVQLSVMEH